MLMGEKIMSPGEQLAFVFKVVITLLTIFVLLTLFVNTRPVIETNSLARANAEIMENIYSSQIAAGRAVFNAKELDKLRDSEAEVVRHCGYGYSLLVQTKDDQWLFGYRPKVFTNAPYATQEYPAAVVKNGVVPAKASLTVYDSMLTRISCAIEKAYKLGDVQTTETPCSLTATEGGKFSIKKKQQNSQQFMCVGVVFATSLLFSKQPAQMPEESECRYLPDVAFDDLSSECKNSAKAKLKAYPVKAGTKDCKSLKENPGLLAKKGEVNTVILCIE